ncbi:MAG: hypothetical protein ACAI44_29175 [Candidatus Sericytochromatia bacterium]
MFPSPSSFAALLAPLYGPALRPSGPAAPPPAPPASPPTPSGEDDPRIFKIETEAPGAPLVADYDFQSQEVVDGLARLDHGQSHYRDGVCFGELLKLDKAAGDDHQLSEEEAIKAKLFKTATPEARADLAVINSYLAHAHEMDPNQMAFPARLKGSAKQTEVTGYGTGRLSEAQIIAQFQQVDATIDDKSNAYAYNGTGCEALTNALHGAVLGKEVNSSTALSDYKPDVADVKGVRDTPFTKANFMDLIRDGKLKPGMTILINSDPNLELGGDAGNLSSINSKPNDRHWFTYMGLDAQKQPVLLDNLNRKRSLDNMLSNFPTEIPRAYSDAHAAALNTWKTKVVDETGKQPTAAEITEFDKQFKAEYKLKYAETHGGRKPPHSETMIFDNPGGQMSIHSLVDFYSDEAPPDSPLSRARFERIAQGISDTVPGQTLP